MRLRSPFEVRNVCCELGGRAGNNERLELSHYRMEVEYRFARARERGVVVALVDARALYGMFPRSMKCMERGNDGDFGASSKTSCSDMERRRGPRRSGDHEGKARSYQPGTLRRSRVMNSMVIEAVGRAIRVWVKGSCQ